MTSWRKTTPCASGREALRRVEKSGPSGENHFYICFNTKSPGVDIGERMAQRYPREMTIVPSTTNTKNLV